MVKKNVLEKVELSAKVLVDFLACMEQVTEEKAQATADDLKKAPERIKAEEAVFYVILKDEHGDYSQQRAPQMKTDGVPDYDVVDTTLVKNLNEEQRAYQAAVVMEAFQIYQESQRPAIEIAQTSSTDGSIEQLKHAYLSANFPPFFLTVYNVYLSHKTDEQCKKLDVKEDFKQFCGMLSKMLDGVEGDVTPQQVLDCLEAQHQLKQSLGSANLPQNFILALTHWCNSQTESAKTNPVLANFLAQQQARLLRYQANPTMVGHDESSVPVEMAENEKNEYLSTIFNHWRDGVVELQNFNADRSKVTTLPDFKTKWSAWLPKGKGLQAVVEHSIYKAAHQALHRRWMVEVDGQKQSLRLRQVIIKKEKYKKESAQNSKLLDFNVVVESLCEEGQYYAFSRDTVDILVEDPLNKCESQYVTVEGVELAESKTSFYARELTCVFDQDGTIFNAHYLRDTYNPFLMTAAMFAADERIDVVSDRHLSATLTLVQSAIAHHFDSFRQDAEDRSIHVDWPGLIKHAQADLVGIIAQQFSTQFGLQAQYWLKITGSLEQYLEFEKDLILYELPGMLGKFGQSSVEIPEEYQLTHVRRQEIENAIQGKPNPDSKYGRLECIVNDKMRLCGGSPAVLFLDDTTSVMADIQNEDKHKPTVPGQNDDNSLDTKENPKNGLRNQNSQAIDNKGQNPSSATPEHKHCLFLGVEAPNSYAALTFQLGVAARANGLHQAAYQFLTSENPAEYTAQQQAVACIRYLLLTADKKDQVRVLTMFYSMLSKERLNPQQIEGVLTCAALSELSDDLFSGYLHVATTKFPVSDFQAVVERVTDKCSKFTLGLATARHTEILRTRFAGQTNGKSQYTSDAVTEYYKSTLRQRWFGPKKLLVNQLAENGELESYVAWLLSSVSKSDASRKYLFDLMSGQKSWFSRWRYGDHRQSLKNAVLAYFKHMNTPNLYLGFNDFLSNILDFDFLDEFAVDGMADFMQYLGIKKDDWQTVLSHKLVGKLQCELDFINNKELPLTIRADRAVQFLRQFLRQDIRLSDYPISGKFCTHVVSALMEMINSVLAEEAQAHRPFLQQMKTELTVIKELKACYPAESYIGETLEPFVTTLAGKIEETKPALVNVARSERVVSGGDPKTEQERRVLAMKVGASQGAKWSQFLGGAHKETAVNCRQEEGQVHAPLARSFLKGTPS